MTGKKIRRSSSTQRPSLRNIDWESAHLFIAVARSGSFRAAAATLGQSVNALRRRLAAFERHLGTTLLTRHVDGVRLTEEGERIFEAACQMEAASFRLIRAADQVQEIEEGEVKLAITEGIGSFWVAPRLAQLVREHPNIRID